MDNARNLISSLFFNPRRYDLGNVGRYKLNKHLGIPRTRPESAPWTKERRRRWTTQDFDLHRRAS